MTRTLRRSCLGCGRSVRGKPRCSDCQRVYAQAKRARRPDLHNDAKERERRRRVVADHRALIGDWCPGWAKQPAHQSADLTADHVKEVAKGGSPAGRLVVRCRSCNSAKAAAIIARALGGTLAPSGARLLQRSDQRVSPQGTPPTTPRKPNAQLHSGDDGPAGPVVA